MDWAFQTIKSENITKAILKTAIRSSVHTSTGRRVNDCQSRLQQLCVMRADEKIGGPDGGIMGCLSFTQKRGTIVRRFSAASVLFLDATERRGESRRPIAQSQDTRRGFQSEKTKNAKTSVMSHGLSVCHSECCVAAGCDTFGSKSG